GPKHLPGQGPDWHDAGDRPHDFRRRHGRRSLSWVRPLDRLVWVGAFPHEGNEDVRSIVSVALEAGFDEIVLAKQDESLRGSGRSADSSKPCGKTCPSCERPSRRFDRSGSATACASTRVLSCGTERGCSSGTALRACSSSTPRRPRRATWPPDRSG